MNFKVSDKVVCVDDTPPEAIGKGLFKIPPKPLVKGRVYVIKETMPNLYRSPSGRIYYSPNGGTFGVRLTGVFHGITIDGDEGMFRSTRFRKLDEIRDENRAKHEKRKLIQWIIREANPHL